MGNEVLAGKVRVGKVKFFNSQKGKGYGFLVDKETGKEYFFHYTAIDSSSKYKKMNKGWTVRYIIGEAPDGRECAAWVCSARDLSFEKENSDETAEA